MLVTAVKLCLEIGQQKREVVIVSTIHYSGKCQKSSGSYTRIFENCIFDKLKSLSNVDVNSSCIVSDHTAGDIPNNFWITFRMQHLQELTL